MLLNYIEKAGFDMGPQAWDIQLTMTNFTRTCTKSGLYYGTPTEVSRPYLYLL